MSEHGFLSGVLFGISVLLLCQQINLIRCFQFVADLTEIEAR